MMPRLRLVRSARRVGSPAFLTAFAAATLALVTACHDGTVATTDPASGSVATLGFNAQVVAGAATAELRVNSSYVQIGGARVPLGTQSTPLANTREQLVPLTVDLGACLRDPQRQSGTAPASPDDCLVQLDLQLVVDGAVVDRQTLGPLSLRGGQTQTLDNVITLTDIGTITVRSGTDSVSTRLEVGRTVALATTVLDGARRPVSGRTIEWASSTPAVATVSAAGVVTAVAPGTARITASTGGRSGAIEVRVVLPPQTLRILPSSGTGSAVVRSAPGGINCAIEGLTATGTCAADFASDQTVELTATTGTNTELLGWSGNCSATVGPVCRVSMGQAVNTGPILRALGTITIGATGSGTGLVTSDVGTINCQVVAGNTAGNCSATYVQGTLVQLRATSSGASSFLGWSGACTGLSPTCVVEVNAARLAVARFELQVPLSVQALGLGSGTVVSSPAGINCSLSNGTFSGTCTTLFTQGTSVTLTATPSGNNTLRRWGGDCAAAVGANCTLVISGGGRTASAQFEPPAVITVALTGTGAGEVTGGVVSCQRVNGSNSGSCSTSVPAGSSVTLTAAAQSNSEFAGWSGVCSGSTAPTCTFTAERNTVVAATFRSLLAIITASPASGATGLGFVSNSDESLSCQLNASTVSGTCTITRPPGTSVTVQAFADATATFDGWGGVCAAALSNSSCTFTTTSGTNSITALFTQRPLITITVELTGSTSGTATLFANGGQFSRSCTHNPAQRPTTTCAWSVPQALTFDVLLFPVSGSAIFTSATNELCYQQGASCSVSPGPTAATTIRALFTVSPSESPGGGRGSLRTPFQ